MDSRVTIKRESGARVLYHLSWLLHNLIITRMDIMAKWHEHIYSPLLWGGIFFESVMCTGFHKVGVIFIGRVFYIVFLSCPDGVSRHMKLLFCDRQQRSCIE